MSSNLLFQSFAGGEITPELYGRLDLGKFQTGLAQALNCIVLPHGPIQKRPGTAFVNEAFDVTKNVRLIPFSFSDDQTMVLEFGHQYIRFHTNGGTLLEALKNITAAALGATTVLTSAGHGYANGDWVYLLNFPGDSTPELNSRFYKLLNVTANTFEVRAMDGSAIDSSAFTPYIAGGQVQRVYKIASPYNGPDLFSLRITQSADVMTITHLSYQARELRRVALTNWTLGVITFAPVLAAMAAPGAVVGGPGGGVPQNYFYATTAVAADGLEESLGSPSSVAANVDLTVAGNFVTVTPGAAVGATRVNIYRRDVTGLFGYVGQVLVGDTFTDDGYTPDFTKTPPQGLIGLNTVAGTDTPNAVTYHDQRRVFGDTNSIPSMILMTRPGTESNMTSSIPTQDDDAIEIRLKATKQQRIRHLVSLTDLIAFTNSSVFKIGSGNDEAITPTNIAPKQQGAFGSANVQPIVANNAVLYSAARGSHIRELAYSFEKNGYGSTDLSIMAPHLFDGYQVFDMAYTEAPTQALWCARSDGALVAMTYVPEHQVFAWHAHSSPDAFYESVCAVAEGLEDALYVVVRRIVNGRTVRYIERMATRRVSAKEDWFGVDCGATYSGAPTDTISNLHHLEGETVVALADGSVEPAQVVTGGRITISGPASKVHVGLAYTMQARLLPLHFAQAAASGVGRVKNVNAVHVRTRLTTGLKIGPSADKLTDIPTRETEDWGQPPALQSRVESITITPTWNKDGNVVLQHDDPVPCMIESVALDVAAGG